MNENGKNLEELVKQLLKHDVDVDNKWKRHSAAIYLGRFKDLRAVNSLIEALEDYESDVRWAAIKALSMIGELAVEPLIQALKDEKMFVSSGAATALGMIGDMQAIEPLIQALKDKDSWVRWRAAEALAKLGDIQAIKPLETLLVNEKRRTVIEAVIKALEQLK